MKRGNLAEGRQARQAWRARDKMPVAGQPLRPGLELVARKPADQRRFAARRVDVQIGGGARSVGEVDAVDDFSATVEVAHARRRHVDAKAKGKLLCQFRIG